MTQQQESRQDEVARVRGYLTTQAAKRTPAQIVEALREAQQALVGAMDAITEAGFRTPPRAGEWAAADVLEHVRQMTALEELSITAACLRGEQPANVRDQIEPAPPDATGASLLAAIAASRERLIAVALAADPQAHLDVTWSHPEFGQMNWREWLLFGRVHMLDHVRQLQAVAETAVAQ